MSADLKSPYERSAALLTTVDERGLKDESLARHLPYLSALDDHILMTRQGDLLASAVIEGLDSFTSDDGELDVAGQSFARLVGQLGDGFGYHVNKITIPETVALRDFEGDSFEGALDPTHEMPGLNT